METKKRKTGIGVVGDRPWGSHLCLFYETKEDLLDMVVPYLKAGFESGEYCVWVIPDMLTLQEARQALNEILSEMGRYSDGQNFEIHSGRDLYLSRRSRNQTVDSGRTTASAVRAILDDPPIHIRPDVPAARVQSKQTLWVYAIPAHL